MIAFLLCLIIALIAGVLALLRLILNELRKTDFSKEDASVKAAAEQVKEAIDKLPKPKEKHNAS